MRLHALLAALAIALSAMVLHTSDATALSTRRLCRLACRNEVTTCIQAGSTRRACRREIEGTCRHDGIATCVDPTALRAGKSWALIAPSTLQATAQSSSEIALAWDDPNTQEQGYYVERSLDGISWKTVSSLAANATADLNTLLDPGTRYYFRVRAYKAQKRSMAYSPYSPVAQATTFPSDPRVSTTTSTSTSTSTSTTASSSTTSTSTSTSTSTTTSGVNHAPVAIPGPDRVTTVGQINFFDATGSYDPDPGDSIVQYIWNFGETTNYVYQAQWFYAYSTPGTYTAKLWVQDSHGTWGYAAVTVVVEPADSSTTSTSSTSTTSSTTSSTSTTQRTTTSTSTSTTSSSTTPSTSTSTSTSSSTSTSVPNQQPVAKAGADVSTQTNTPVPFSATGSYDPDGSIVSYTWTFGDGSPAASGFSTSHSYARAGTYLVALTVRDDDGAVGTDAAVVTVANRPPVADAGPDVQAVAGVAVGFDGSGSNDPDGTIVSWSWTFGDGAGGSGQQVSHAYQSQGTYTVRLTVTDDLGASSTDSAVVSVGAPTSSEQWVTAAAGSATQMNNETVVDGAGNVLVAGLYSGTMSLGTTTLSSVGATTDAYVAKYDPAGRVLWARSFGGSGSDIAEGLATDAAGNVVVAGRFTGTASFGTQSFTSAGGSDVFVVKLSASGVQQWVRTYGGPGDDGAYAAAVDSAGNIVLTGSFVDTIDFGGATLGTYSTIDTDAFLAKLSPAGVHVWSKEFYSTDAEIGYGVAVAPGDDIVVAGIFGGYLNLGGSTLVTSGLSDGFLARFTAAGAHRWSRKFGATEADRALAVAVDAGGNTYVTGEFRSSVDFGGGTLSANLLRSDAFVASYTSAGAYRWARGMGDPTQNDTGWGVAADGNGNVTVVGEFRGTMGNAGGPSLTSAGLRDVFVAQYTSAGAYRWSDAWGGSDDDRGLGVGAAGTGAVATAGSFRGSGMFGGAALSSMGGVDAFLVHLP